MAVLLDRGKLDELSDLTGGDHAWIRELYETFLRSSSDRLDALEALVAAGTPDRRGVHEAAHYLKGAAGGVGAKAFFDACRALMLEAEALEPADLRARALALRPLFDETRQAIDDAVLSA